jgi:hypothetical protein
MLEEIYDVKNVGEFIQLAPCIIGKKRFPANLMIKGACKWFEMLGYQVMKPNSDTEKSKRKDACTFLNADDTFGVKPAEIKDTILI